MSTGRASRWRASRLIGLSEGTRGSSVRVLQRYLRRYGYFRHSERLCAKEFQYSRYGPNTLGAVQDFQRFNLRRNLKYKLGVVDAPTAVALEKDRCGAQDRGVCEPRRWNVSQLRYKVTDLPPQLEPHRGDIEGLIGEAAERWSSVIQIPIRAENDPRRDVEITVLFHGETNHQNHPDLGFDGEGNVLAHAFGPPIPGSGACPYQHPGDVHFDESERWVVSGTFNSDLFLNVSLHELGHAIGLCHTNQMDSLMRPGLGEPYITEIPKLDRRRARALYGI